jgi:hypothetical protein
MTYCSEIPPIVLALVQVASGAAIGVYFTREAYRRTIRALRRDVEIARAYRSPEEIKASLQGVIDANTSAAEEMLSARNPLFPGSDKQ